MLPSIAGGRPRTRGSAVLGSGVALLALVVAHGASPAKKQPYTTWSDYAGTPDSMQYSALKQINKNNVGRLKLAWSLMATGPAGRFAFNPLIVDGVMYVVGKDNAIMALDAATGKQIWTHPLESQPTNRGFNYWESKDRSDRRIIYGVSGYLQEISAKTGVTINTFGDDGRVDMRKGSPRPLGGPSGTPGRVFENILIVGSNTGEGYGSAPGDLRGFDVVTGKLLWTFHTIPHPGEFGYDTWPPDAWKYIGGVNAWGEISIDEKRGIAYFPLGSPTYDFYGADRVGANLFGNSLVALDARSGKRLWHFQAVHHDLWDYDLTAAPKLLMVKHNGKTVDIVAIGTKTGFLYVFDRVTGEPLWPIEERPVPKSDVPGEVSWPTQPFPTKPPAFARQSFKVEDVNPHVDEAEFKRLQELVRNARMEGIFTPATAGRNQISIPGELGGTNWGGMAGDPQTGMLYVRTIDGPALHNLSERTEEARLVSGTPEQIGRSRYMQHCVMCHGPERTGIRPPKEIGAERITAIVRGGQGQMPAIPADTLPTHDLTQIMAYLDNPAAGAPPPGDRPATRPPSGQTRYYGQFGNLLHANNGLPVIGPPWSELVAYDLNEGTIKWRTTLGVVSALAEKGIRNTGSYRPTRNGPVVTAGGLIFIGTASDRSLHAYDKDTGKLLWETEIEANPDGIPAVYEVGGRQYVAFYAGAQRSYRGIPWKAAKPEAQGYYVYALPRK